MVFEKVREILVKQLGVSESKVTKDTNLTTDLGADSLDLVEILMSLEEEFNVSIPDEVIPEIKTINDLVKFIEKAKK